MLLGTGSEVQLCVAAGERLTGDGLSVRVVSMPSWELFAAQSDEYRADVLPPGVPTLAVEAGVTLGWERYADDAVGIDHFGASAPGDVVLKEFGFTVDNVVARAPRPARARSPGLTKARRAMAGNSPIRPPATSTGRAPGTTT